MKFIVYPSDHRAVKAGEILRDMGSEVVYWNPNENKVTDKDVVLFSSAGIYKRGDWVRMGVKLTDPEVKGIVLPDWATGSKPLAVVAINTGFELGSNASLKFKDALHHVRLNYDPKARRPKVVKRLKSREEWTSGHHAQRRMTVATPQPVEPEPEYGWHDPAMS